MTTAHPDPTLERPLRLWPGVTIVLLQWGAMFGQPLLMPEAQFVGVLAGLAGGLAVVAWWLFFSRAPMAERWGALLLIIAALAVTPRILHESVRHGMMGFLFFIYAIPTLSLALVGAAVVGRRLSRGLRRAVSAGDSRGG